MPEAYTGQFVGRVSVINKEKKNIHQADRNRAEISRSWREIVTRVSCFEQGSPEGLSKEPAKQTGGCQTGRN